MRVKAVAAKDDACIDPDQEFQTFGSGLLILLDTMLFADPLYACYRESSSPVIGTVLIYLNDVPPEAGTLVLMRSDAVEHEVLETAAPRHCVVGWFRQERCGVLTPT